MNSESYDLNPPAPGELFVDLAARAVWAAALTLPLAQQHQLLEELTVRLQAATGETWDARKRRLVAALREAAQMLGHSPSVREYERLRSEQAEPYWPDSTTVRRWAGGSWNDALRQSGLEATPDGDVLAVRGRSGFESEQIIRAVQACARELERVPTFYGYAHWAKRPDVIERHGPTPRSQETIERRFGSWNGLLEAAGLSDAERAIEIGDSGFVRIGYRVTDEVCIAALKEVAERLGKTPTTHEYSCERRKIIEESRQTGVLRTLPSLPTIQKQFNGWGQALEAAGLEAKVIRKTGDGQRFPATWTDEELVEIVREALADEGAELRRGGYERWRKKKRAEAEAAGKPRRIPDSGTLVVRLGGNWEKVKDAARGS